MDSEINWYQQQYAKKRVKRDYNKPAENNPSYSDPLYMDQWYLHGGAQKGYDMNVLPVWKAGYTGKGVVISILDDGIEKDHPDLKDNYDPKASFDVNGKDDDPTPRYDTTDENRHGTRCAGEVSATANNSYCGVGVAYNSNIGGVRMLDGFVTDAVEAQALGLNFQHIDIYSASWGPDDNGQVVDGPGPLATHTFVKGIHMGRGGKGSIFVWASGNGGNSHDSCNCDGYTNSIFTLSISSTSQRGVRPWYLEECSSTIATTYSSGSFGEPQIVTVDLKKTCTTSHTGTSASAPLAAGIVALMLEANNKLTWRDVQYITLLTARPEPLADGEWITNGLGRKISLRYGYGLMNAAAMVDYALRWTLLPKKSICEVKSDIDNKSLFQDIQDTYRYELNVDGCNSADNGLNYLEHVQAEISLVYSHRGDVRIYLTSPNGTRSLLLPPRPNDWREGSFNDWPFLSVHFWGENPVGKWVLEIQNAARRVNHGVLRKWKLILHGTKEKPIELKSKDFLRPRNRNRGHSMGNVSGSDVFRNTTEFTCHSECKLGCIGPGDTHCIECLHFRLGATGPCVPSCLEGFYGNNITGECCLCRSTCKNCSSLDNCIACQPGYAKQPDGQCTKVCPEGSYAGIDAHTCKPCSVECAVCLGSYNKCISCPSGKYLIENKCLDSADCPPNEFSSNGRCSKCNHLCKTCNGSTAGDCRSCHRRFILLNNTCVLASCDLGFYEVLVQGTQRICKRCHETCSSCTGPLSSQCLSCALNRIPVMGFCLLQGTEKNTTGYSLEKSEKPHNTWIVLAMFLAVSVIITVIIIVLYYAQLKNKLCWAYRYEKVVLLIDDSTDKIVLTNGDSGDDDIK